MFGFKATDTNLKCNNFQFKLNETFHHSGILEMCKSGFHFCEKLININRYYSFNKKNRFFIVKSGNTYKTQVDKLVTDEITLLKEITSDNLMSLVENNEYRDFLKKNVNGLLMLSINLSNENDLLKIAKYLHENGADITVENNYVIRWVSHNGHLEVVKYLHTNGINITVENNIAVRWASQKGHLEVVKYLHTNGADITAVNNYAIICASHYGHLEVVKYLHENGAYITAENNYAIILAS